MVNAIGQSQEQGRVNIVFKGFPRSGSPERIVYVDRLNERTRTQLIELQKFNVIKRDPAIWKAIEDELKIQDFIDAGTAIKLGNMFGARYYVEGKLTSFTTDRKVNYSSSTGAIESVTYTTNVEASLNLVDLETGKYEMAASASKTHSAGTAESSVEQSLNQLVGDLCRSLSKKFLIEGHVVAVESDKVRIDKGLNDGVKHLESFHISVPNGDVVKIKIIEASSHESVGKIMTGDIKNVAAGQTVKESEAIERTSLHISRKIKNIVYLDGGANLGIKKRDILVHKQQTKVDIGSRVILEEKPGGIIYLTEVKSDYAKGKIIKGFRNITTGSVVSEAEDEVDVKLRYVKLGYKSGLGIQIDGNPRTGQVLIENKLGSFDIDTDYNSNNKTLKTVSVYSLGFGTQNLVKEITTSLNFDIYNIGNGKLHNWISNLEVTYNHTLVPEKIYLLAGGALGYGRLKQKIPGRVIEILSEGNSSDAKARSLFASGVIGIQASINRLYLGCSASFDYLNYTNWKYDIKGSDGSSETAVVPDEVLPYPEVNLTGLYVKGTIGVRIGK